MATASKTIIENDLLLRAIAHEEVERPPVWMMRQAGRYLPEYREIRSQFSFLDLCKNPKMAAKVSIQPLRRLAVDAIIMFSDILIPLEPMGAPVSFDTGSPKFLDPIRTSEQVKKIIVPSDIEKDCSFVYDVIHEIRDQITTDGKQAVPVLGFAGAPWTMASYVIEGGGSKDFAHIKSFMYNESSAMHELLEKLSETISEYLIAKLNHGVDAVQLFDTWAGQLSQSDYKEFALPYQQKIITNIRKVHPDAKITLYVNGVANVLDYMIQSGADMLSVDWRVNLKEIRSYLEGADRKIAVQGNFDPCQLLGSPEQVAKKTKAMLDEAMSVSKTGYVANLGHGIIPSVPVDSAKSFIDTVKNYK